MFVFTFLRFRDDDNLFKEEHSTFSKLSFGIRVARGHLHDVYGLLEQQFTLGRDLTLDGVEGVKVNHGEKW